MDEFKGHPLYKQAFKRFVRRCVERISFLHRHVDWSDKLVTAEQVRYVLGLSRLYDMVEDVPGHVVELGVGRGRNAVIFGTLFRESRQHAFRRYYGFDTFDGYPDDVQRAESHLSSHAHRDTSLSFVEEIRDRNDLAQSCRFVSGDFRQTLPRFIEQGDSVLAGFSPGSLRIALIYIDCNASGPALHALRVLTPYLSDRAVIAIDEARQGGEIKALESFAREHDLEIHAGHSGSVSAWVCFRPAVVSP